MMFSGGESAMRQFNILLLFAFLTVLTGCGGQGGAGGDDDGAGPGGGTDPDPTDFPSSGIPDQNSFSISVDVLNPRAGSRDGTTVTLTARLADQLGNNSTIPDGTEVFFAADGGSIQSSCTTTNGACSVTWTSQIPRPPAGPAVADPLGSGDMVPTYSANRATVLVWASGIESFIDNNSNGLFDDGDIRDPNDPDRGEAFIDRNEDGNRDANEEFVDYLLGTLGGGGGGFTYDAADGLYSGANCEHSTDCADNDDVFVYQNIELAMSTDSICIVPVDPGVAPCSWGSTVVFTEPVDLKNDRDEFYFLIHDCMGNPPMSETTVSFNSAVGEVYDNAGTVPSTNVDMGTTDTGSTRQCYPSNSLVYTALVLEDLANTTNDVGIFEIEVSNDAGDFSEILQLLDPMN
jgi:hypothetical protein